MESPKEQLIKALRVNYAEVAKSCGWSDEEISILELIWNDPEIDPIRPLVEEFAGSAAEQIRLIRPNLPHVAAELANRKAGTPA